MLQRQASDFNAAPTTVCEQTTRVLLVEDNPVDARLIAGLLKPGPDASFEVHAADQLAAALEYLTTETVDVVLLDLTLPDSSGLESFEHFHRRHPELPIVILTGLEDEALAARAIQSGAQDYLLKGQDNRTSLARSLRYAIERKRAAEAILRLNEELERRVEQRTHELSASNRELEAFCHSVAHDLRTPLRAIDGFGSALEKQATTLDDRGRDYLQRIRLAAQRMGQLIDAMLDLSRFTRCPLRMEKVDLSAAAREIVAQLQPSHAPQQVRFRIAAGLTTQGDSQLLWIVLENLLDNAWKFSRGGCDPLVEFGIEQPDGQCVFYVRDNGVGFDMTYADKLFGTFERLHGAEFEGLGIGLATVQRILQRHGGRVWAESEPGRGSIFRFTLATGSQPRQGVPSYEFADRVTGGQGVRGHESSRHDSASRRRSE
jgi:signal transduction histidine kinase